MTDQTWQEMIALYLDTEFCHSAGDYKAAVKLLDDAQAAAPAKSGDYLPKRFGAIADLARKLNNQLLETRYTAHHEHRHPLSPGDLLGLDGNSRTFDHVHSFYAVGITALKEASADDDKLGTLREAIVRNYGDLTHLEGSRDRIAQRIAARFAHRTVFAQEVLHTTREAEQVVDAEIDDFLEAGVDGRGKVPAFVLGAFFQAHINRYTVEHRRSVPVGKTLARSKTVELAEDADLLKQAVALLTFTIAICLNYPWLFADQDGERRALQPPFPDENDGVETTKPDPAAMSEAAWLARQLLLLSIYRRAHIFRLLGEHQRSYNDLRKVQRMSRETRLPLPVTDPRNKNLNTLIMLAEFRIGELYRADHDAAQGLVHLCRSHDLVNAWQRYAGVNESALFQVHISLSKGKAFLEIGAIKRALKWYVRAWVALERLVGIEHPAGDPELAAALRAHLERVRHRPPEPAIAEAEGLLAQVEQPSDEANPVAALDAYLTRIKHAPELDKAELRRYLDPTIERLSALLPDHRYDALAADVLVRISHVLLVLRLEDDGRSRHAETLLVRAAELDRFNLLAWSGLLRCELRGMDRHDVEAPDAMKCWPSGARDVDQAIRVGEYLMLKRVRDGRQEQSTATGEDEAPEPADREVDSINADVARELLNHFHTHTDSINLRLGIMHRYLMKARADDKRELDELLGGRAPDERALEFVCLRRYGSFHPLMPRPAAVSAVGGGYLIRVFAANGTEPRAFNVLVDPGDGVINNLYRAGLAISDVDMVMVTHDHPDHLTALTRSCRCVTSEARAFRTHRSTSLRQSVRAALERAIPRSCPTAIAASGC